jgi:hypothetical protein
MDWRSMPKGSPERKAAVREQRRKQAALARARKAAKACSVAEPDAADAVGDQKLSYREVIEWVWDHLGAASCIPAATAIEVVVPFPCVQIRW